MTIIRYRDFAHPTTRVCKDVRTLFFVRFGLDWDNFKKHGIPVEELRAPGQHLDLIDRLEIVAKAREAKNGGR